MADGNISVFGGMGLRFGRYKQGKEKCSALHMLTLVTWQVFGNVAGLPHGTRDIYHQFAQACGLPHR